MCFATLSVTATIHGLCSYLTYWMALTHKWEQSSCANNGTHSSARQLSLMRTSVWSNWTKVLVPNNQNQLSNTISRLDICKQLPIKWLQTEEERRTDKMQTERQTNCRHVWTANEYKRKSKRNGERKMQLVLSEWGQKKWYLWIDWVQSISNPNDCWKRSRPDLGWLCQNFPLGSMGVLYQPVSRPYLSVSSSLSLLSLLSLSVVNWNMVEAKHSGWMRFFF